MNGFQWYIVQSHPRKEGFVRERIQDLDREVFLPLVAERRPGRRRVTVGPLFPSYLFAKLSGERGDLARVRWMHGVRRFLGDGEGPRPVEDTVVKTIRARADHTGRVKLGLGLRRGDRVRIVDGPLAGLVGVLQRAASSPEQRVCVLLELFHRTTRVELPANAVGGLAGA